MGCGERRWLAAPRPFDDETTMTHLLIAIPVILLAFGQVLLKRQAAVAGASPAGGLDYLKSLLAQPAFWLAVALAGASFVAWMLVLRRVPLSIAYPFVSLSFPLVALLSVVVLGERVGALQLVGLGLIVAGVAISASHG